MGAISKKWLKNLSEEHKKSHEFLVGTGRNALAAHIDLGKLMPNIFIKDGPHNDYVFNMQLPVINCNTLEHYKELVGAAFMFCQQLNRTKQDTHVKKLVKTMTYILSSFFVIVGVLLSS
ncbi:MAG: hypothetical protein QM484_12480, partial [Woeseiaceae bacterium]